MLNADVIPAACVHMVQDASDRFEREKTPKGMRKPNLRPRSLSAKTPGTNSLIISNRPAKSHHAVLRSVNLENEIADELITAAVLRVELKV